MVHTVVEGSQSRKASDVGGQHTKRLRVDRIPILQDACVSLLRDRNQQVGDDGVLFVCVVPRASEFLKAILIIPRVSSDSIIVRRNPASVDCLFRLT